MTKHNKPQYHLFKNTRYALAGIKDIIQHEPSFRVELVLFVLMQLSILLLSVSFWQGLLLSASLFVPLIVEAINSAIERTVDLVTNDYHEMAKKAKDAGSAAVFLSLMFTLLIWVAVLYQVVLI